MTTNDPLLKWFIVFIGGLIICFNMIAWAIEVTGCK